MKNRQIYMWTKFTACLISIKKGIVEGGGGRQLVPEGWDKYNFIEN